MSLGNFANKVLGANVFTPRGVDLDTAWNAFTAVPGQPSEPAPTPVANDAAVVSPQAEAEATGQDTGGGFLDSMLGGLNEAWGGFTEATGIGSGEWGDNQVERGLSDLSEATGVGSGEWGDNQVERGLSSLGKAAKDIGSQVADAVGLGGEEEGNTQTAEAGKGPEGGQQADDDGGKNDDGGATK